MKRLIVAVAIIPAALASAHTIVPDAMSNVAVLTPGIAYSDPRGVGAVKSPEPGSNQPPAYESVHLMEDDRIAEIGWIGIHALEYSNEVKAFNPGTGTMEQITPWEKQLSASDPTPMVPPLRTSGVNRYHNTYDNHPSFYFRSLGVLGWMGHGIIDVKNKQHLAGSRAPAPRNYFTQPYIMGNRSLAEGKIYNPAYAQCPVIDAVVFYGASAGGIGDKQGLNILRRSGNPDAPLAISTHSLAASGIPPMERARNTAVCIGSKFYVGGGTLRAADGSTVLNHQLWEIDLVKLTAVKISDNFGLGVWDTFPQLVHDTRRNRLVLLGVKATTFDLARRQWAELKVQGWPTGGYKHVGGAYVASRDAIYFRGTPNDYKAGDPRPWQWNRIQF
jgi:hypothetical protein